MYAYSTTTIDESKFYMGATAYLKNNAQTKASLNILAEAVPQLAVFTTINTAQFAEQKMVRDSAEFRHIQQDSVYFSNDESFPIGTPADRQVVSLTHVSVKGHDFLKLHIPAITPDAMDMKELVEDNLLPLLQHLFGSDLVTVKTKCGSTINDFTELHNETDISANRFSVIA